MVLTVSYQAAVHSFLGAQNTFVMKINCSILESCVAIIIKHKSSKETPKLTLKKILLMSLKVNESRYRRRGVTPHFPKTKK